MTHKNVHYSLLSEEQVEKHLNKGERFLCLSICMSVYSENISRKKHRHTYWGVSSTCSFLLFSYDYQDIVPINLFLQIHIFMKCSLIFLTCPFMYNWKHPFPLVAETKILPNLGALYCLS